MSFKKLFFYLYAALVVMLTWPLFAAWIPVFVKSWYWYPVGVIFGFLFISEYFKTRQFVYILWYIVVVYLNCFMGDKYIYDPIAATTRFLGLIFITSAPLFFIQPNKERVRYFFYIFFLILLIAVSIASYYWNTQFPNVIRDDITITGSDEVYEFAYLYRFGLTRYQFAHAVPIIIPPLVMAYKIRKRIIEKVFFAFVVFLCLVHTYVSNSTTAFMMAVIAVLLSFMVSPNMTKKQTWRIVMLGVVLFPLLSENVFSSILGFIDWATGSEGAIHDHIADMQQSIVSKSTYGTVGARQDRYAVSWQMFFQNPFIGTNDETGNHSVFIDHLGSYGIIGFFPLFAFLWVEFKAIMKRLGANNRVYYYISGFCAFSLMALKNAHIWDINCFLFVAAPIFFLEINRDIRQQNSF